MIGLVFGYIGASDWLFFFSFRENRFISSGVIRKAVHRVLQKSMIMMVTIKDILPNCIYAISFSICESVELFCSVWHFGFVYRVGYYSLTCQSDGSMLVWNNGELSLSPHPTGYISLVLVVKSYLRGISKDTKKQLIYYE